jgi:formylglycine-generating enzyme required for sulfatase activity
MITNRPLRVFLCHSSNDKPAVRELYQKLLAETWIQPWLDEEELYPGQDWNFEIEKAVEAADLIIVCLSKGSTTKEGYVQREIRVALDYADYKPEGTLYIIPVRLEECEPPPRLRIWPYADYFEGQRERGIQRLLISLKRRAEGLGLIFEVPAPKNEEKPDVEKQVADETPKPTPKSEAKQNQNIAAPRKEKKPIEEKKAVAEAPVREKKSKSIQGKPASIIETLKPSLANHPTAEWIAGNKITLSNGMELMRVPAGKFLIGSTKENILLDERPRHAVDIPYEYLMARFPVTNESYNAYIKAKGIKHPVDGWASKKEHPVVHVKWTDAIEYCQWLNSLLKAELPGGLVLRLPTEAEWEKAARGTNGREFPWGNQFDRNKCNSSEGGKCTTTPVGLYSPQGDSPYGCADLAGNVWEWTHSLVNEYPYKANDGREYEKASGNRVLRGGSFNGIDRSARCAYRIVDVISSYLNIIGFRVVASPSLPESSATTAATMKEKGFWIG